MKRAVRRWVAVSAIGVAMMSGGFALGQAKPADPVKPADPAKPAEPVKPAPKKKGGKADSMDYGPFLSASIISHPKAKFDNGPGSFTGDSTARGIAVQLSPDWADGIVFDQDLLRMSCGWVDGGLVFAGLIGDGGHGFSPYPSVPPLFQTPHLPGWADKAGSFDDPRPDSIAPLPPPGNLPAERGAYKGLYRHGDRVVLAYTVNGVEVLESPGLEKAGDRKALARTIRIDKSDAPQALMIADINPQYPYPRAQKIANIAPVDPNAKTSGGSVDGSTATLGDLHVAVVGLPKDAKLEIVKDSQLVLKLPASSAAATFKVLVSGGGEAAKDAFAALAKASAQPEDLVALTKGGPAKWTEQIATKGVLGQPAKDQPYVTDQLTVPHDNPYSAWMRIGGFDFFPGGTKAALSTWSGDVWIVDGIDDSLANLQWKRFATGLHQPLGLKIVGDKIYTVGHDQITRFHDLNGDGEADFYENFNDDWELTTAFHAFCFDLHTDPQGNFVFAFGGPVHAGGGGFQKITNHHGTVMKVSPDGKKLEVYATGFRAPNGIGVHPETGQVTTGDNEGTWVPKCPIHWVEPKSFNGVMDMAHGLAKGTPAKPAPEDHPKPLCWMPKGVDNSGGGQVWVTSDRWGPFKGDLLHMSYGTSSLYKVMYEKVNGQIQGGVVKLPVKFTSSAMRARFNERDGQLYVAGLKGWQSNAGKDGGFDRVRYTGGPVRMPKELHVKKAGVAITFTCDLDPALANDAGNYDVEAWNYRWTSGYGSGEFPIDAADPKAKVQKGQEHTTLKVKSAKLQADGKTVMLEIEGIKPVMQMKITYNIAAADRVQLRDSIHNTIHELGADAVTAR